MKFGGVYIVTTPPEGLPHIPIQGASRSLGVREPKGGVVRGNMGSEVYVDNVGASKEGDFTHMSSPYLLIYNKQSLYLLTCLH